MTDDEFLRAFSSLSLPHQDFHHRDHLRLAWLAIRRDGAPAAEEVVTRGIERYAAAHGHGERYHETITRFWVRLVAHAMRAEPRAGSLDDLLEAHPLLLDGRLPLRHWTREALFAPEAQTAWRSPDLQALPF